MSDDFDDFEFDSESEEEHKEDEGGKRPVHDLAQIISDEAGTDFAWTTEHVLLCRLISLYGRCALKPGEQETWVRSVALNVLIYECITAGVLDFDYAPVLTDISYRGESKRVWLNLSQEAMAAIDDLRSTGMIRAVRMYTEDYKASTGFQVSLAGLGMMKAVPQALFDELRHVVYVPDAQNTYKDMVQISWNPHKDIFALKSDKTGYFRYSTITEIEDVSYVSSPYIPNVLRRGVEPTTDNRGRAEEAFAGMSNMKDADLMEAITLAEVRYLLVEWVPFGENSIAHMCLNLGALERNHHGMFSSTIDMAPTELVLNVPAGLTHVKILDYDLMHHINVEAEINYPEEEGIVQVEFFGIHISTRGNVVFGLQLDSMMTRKANDLSIDLLTRMAVDVVQDSSTILDDMMTQYQREQMEALFQGHSDVRKKYCAYVAKGIEPHFATYQQYLDGQDHENEIAQIIGQVRTGVDLTQQHFLFIGTIGLLLVGPKAHEYDAYVVPFCNLQAMMMSAGTVYERFSHIFQMLDEAMNLTHDIESTPYNVGRIQFLMSRASSEINILDLVIKQLEQAVKKALMPPEPRDEVGIRIYSAIKCRGWQTSVLARVKALKNLMNDALRKVGYIRRFTDLINKHNLYHSIRRTNNNASALCLETKNTHKKARNAWLAQWIFGILLLVKLGGKYRTGAACKSIFGCNMLPVIKEVALELASYRGISTEKFYLYYYFEQPDRIYSERCPWVNDWQRWHIDNPYFLMFSVAGIVLAAMFFLDFFSFFAMKRRNRATENARLSWVVSHGAEKMGRICHRFEILMPFDEDKFYMYISNKEVLNKTFRRQVLPGGRDQGHRNPDEYCTIVMLQWLEKENSAWNGLAPTITIWYEQEIGFIRSIKFDVTKRVNGLQIDKAWTILRQRWVAAHVIKHEHSTPEALQAANGKWASGDDDARRAAAIAANIAVAEASAGATMSKKEKAKMLKRKQEEAAKAIMEEFAASEKIQEQLHLQRDRAKVYKGLGRKVASAWKAERREWQAEHRLGAAERRKFHKDAKKRVINRLMRPTLLENIVAAVKAFFEERRASQNKGRSKVQSSADDADIEKGVPGGEEDEEEEEDGPRKGGGGADSDSDEDDAGGGAGKSKGKGAARASSSRGSKGERGLSEAETEADRPEPPDSDDD